MNPVCSYCTRGQRDVAARWLLAREAGLTAIVPCPRCRAAVRELETLERVLDEHADELFAPEHGPQPRAITAHVAPPWLRTPGEGPARGGRRLAAAAIVTLALLWLGATLPSLRVAPVRHPAAGPVRGAAPGRLVASASWDPAAAQMTVVVRPARRPSRYRLRVWSEDGTLLADVQADRPVVRARLPVAALRSVQWQLQRLSDGLPVADTGLRRLASARMDDR